MNLFTEFTESTQSNRRGRKKQATEAFDNLESSSSKRKVSRRQDDLSELTTEIASSVKTASTNKLKRHKSFRSNNQSEPIEISSDEEVPVETKAKNCIASRTRSKAHHHHYHHHHYHSSPSPSKKPKLAQHSSSVSPVTDNHIATLGSNIRKSSTRHHHTESASTSASRRTPVSVLVATSETNSVNNNVS